MSAQSSNTSAVGLLRGAITLPLNTASNLALEPLATGLLLYGLIKAPVTVRDQLLRPLRDRGFSADRLYSLITPLKYLFALGVARRLHQALTRLADNYWHLKQQGEPWKFGDDKLSELVLITGGCSGFGALMTKGFIGKARIVILDILDLPDDLAELPEVYYYKCDITDSSAVMAVAATIRERHGNPSVLINNAGIGASTTILDASVEFTEKIFKVNLVSHFILIKEFLPGMLEARKGHIVTMASLASFLSAPGLVHYCCTKTAANYLNDGLRSELLVAYKNGHTIRTTSVHPGFHDTPMIKQFRTAVRRTGMPLYPAENVSRKVVEHVLQGRSGKLYVPESQYRLSFSKMLPVWYFDMFAGHVKRSRTVEQSKS